MNALPREDAAPGLSVQDRNDLAEQYLPLARAAAGQFAARRRLDAESADENESVAFFALAKAAANFRPELGVSFAVYARETICKSLIGAASRAGYGGRRTRSSNAPRFEPLPDVDSTASCMVDRRTPAPDARLLAEERLGGWWDGLSDLQRKSVQLVSFEGRRRKDAARKLKRPVRAVGDAVCGAVRQLRMVG
jgi:DNA-directed RNA polymerase specialized sigma24 family protein